MVHKAGILDEKDGKCLLLTGKYPATRPDNVSLQKMIDCRCDLVTRSDRDSALKTVVDG
jgi:hypothetical protein